MYEVSNLGKVRNLRTGRLLRPGGSGNGYLLLGLYREGKRYNLLLHRVVAQLFIGPCPDGMVVNHIDGNKRNPVWTNLEYVTLSENQKHAIRLGLCSVPTNRAKGNDHWTRKYPHWLLRGDDNPSRSKPELLSRGADCHLSRLNESSVRQIRCLAENGFALKEIAATFGVSRRNVAYVVSRKQWSHVA